MKLRRSAPRRRAGAFSLAELVVSVGILALMFALAGQVFSLTLRSTGQARALTTVNQALRHLEQTLREDLRYVQPDNSVMVIQGNPVRAYWTQAGRDADDDAHAPGTAGGPNNGYPHPRDPEREDAEDNLLWPRADVLMIFTAREAESFVEPGVTAPAQAVVYGHAELGEYVPVPGFPDEWSWHPVAGGEPVFPFDGTSGYPSPPEESDSMVSPLPAERWHLARRSVLLVPTPAPDGHLWAPSLSDVPVFGGAMDVVAAFNYEEQVLTPPRPPAGDDHPFFRPPALLSPPGSPVPFARSLLDVTPPARLGQLLGHYFLPHCASFKVEWALDPHCEFVDGRLDGTDEVYWFDPGADHPAAGLRAAAGPSGTPLYSLLNESTEHPDGYTYSLADRLGVPEDGHSSADPEWVLAPDGRPNLLVFTATRQRPSPPLPAPPGDLVPGDIFPAALRVTVDVYDEDHRLDRPIRHVFVVPVGG